MRKDGATRVGFFLHEFRIFNDRHPALGQGPLGYTFAEGFSGKLQQEATEKTEREVHFLGLPSVSSVSWPAL